MTTNSATAKDPASGLKAILDAAGVFSGTWVCKTSRMTDEPGDQVVLINRGGRSEMAVAVDYPKVQFIVRSASAEDAYAMATKCRDALLRIPNGGTAYPELTSVVELGLTQDLGRDDKDRMLVSFNLQLIVSYDVSGYRD